MEDLELQATEPKAYTVTWKELEYKVNTKQGTKTIVDHVSGVAQPGEFLALMGPSGAGKSSMLNLLCGNAKKTGGSILINGQPRGKGFKHISSYVRQQDSLFASFTVYETILYAAKLRLPYTLGEEAIEERVQDVIKILGLQRVVDTKIGNTVVRGISGGEKRRVSIAVELVTDPQILWLDEPTSGLDSESSLMVVKSLVKMAKEKKKTIIATIHQPSSAVYNLFDKIMLLSMGKNVFLGSPRESLAFFKEAQHPVPEFYNPPEYFLSILNVDFWDDREQGLKLVNRLMDQFNKSENAALISSQATEAETGPEDTVEEVTSYANPLWYQTSVLLHRSFLNGFRNPLLYWIRVFMYAALALLVGFTWWDLGLGQDAVQDRISLLFFASEFLSFMAVAGIPAIIEEKEVFDRERVNGSYTVKAYVIAGTFTPLPFFALIAFIFSAVVYPAAGLRDDGAAAMKYIFMLFLALFNMETIVVLLAAMFPIFVVALSVTSFLNGFFMIMQGFFLRTESMPSFWIWGQYWSNVRYSFEAFMVNDFKSLIFDCSSSDPLTCFCSYPSDLNAQCQFRGEDVLRQLDYLDVDFWLWAGVLIIMSVVYRLCLYLVLKYKIGIQYKG